jgi:hypothetical protein
MCHGRGIFIDDEALKISALHQHVKRKSWSDMAVP